jgi:histidine ammonia-lyase
MGANAATKCYQVINNTEKVLAIELMCAAQAIEFRRPKKTSPRLEKLLATYRNVVPFIKKDEVIYPAMLASQQFLKNNSLET